MSWYKQSQSKQTITDFADRNIVNHRIHHLEDVASTLKYASDLIYQTQRGARGIIKVLLADKVLSSFPDIQTTLAKADSIALDSPRKFADFCLAAAEHVDRKIGRLKLDRKKATEKGLPRKGLF